MLAQTKNSTGFNEARAALISWWENEDEMCGRNGVAGRTFGLEDVDFEGGIWYGEAPEEDFEDFCRDQSWQDATWEPTWSEDPRPAAFCCASAQHARMSP